MATVAKVLSVCGDALALRRVCGWKVAAQWVGRAIMHGPAIVQRGDLQPADIAMGDGPFLCRRGSAEARLCGPQVLSGIREIWCRDVYLGTDLAIPDGSVVVDLGANMGNFTMLALAHGPGVRVVAVEPNPSLCARLEAQLRLNGWLQRCTVLAGIVGEPSEKVGLELSRMGASGRRPLGFEQVMAAASGRIDFLKCDIEGSEFGLLTPGSGWLEAARQIAMEVHFEAGLVATMEDRLIAAGFAVRRARVSPRDAIVRAWRPVTR